MSLVLLERLDAIAVIRLNRPEQLNLLTREVLEELSSAFKELEQQPDLRAVVLTGSGEVAFCAGTDIEEPAGLTQNEARTASEWEQAVCSQIENFPVPVIAAVNGIAAGGGCELALACHLRVASMNAEFSLPKMKLGMMPADGGIQRLPRELGYDRALELMLTGKVLSAAQGHQLGVVNQVTDPSDVFTAAESLAMDISLLAPLAVRACLKAVAHGLALPLPQGLALETELFASLFATQDMREGTRAFLEKRAPVFKGT